MYVARYLLEIEEFMDAENGEALLARAFLCVDEERREKARRMRPGRARAASLGAGLLLQIGVREGAVACGTELPGRPADASEHRDSGGADIGDAPGSRRGAPFGVAGRADWKRYSVNQLLESLYEKPPAPLAYVYGKEGKPYFRDLPFCFNLSHSGDYVLCIISSEEIGADIQQHCGKNVEKLARRFFTEREAAALEQAGEERERLFYRLWARKEAYGKLTGKGIADALKVDFLPGKALSPQNESGSDGPGGRRLLWEEYDSIAGYSIALCRYG